MMTLFAAFTRYARNTLFRPEIIIIFTVCLFLVLYASLRSENWLSDKFTGLIFLVKDSPNSSPRKRFLSLQDQPPRPPKLKFDLERLYDNINSEDFEKSIADDDDDPDIFFHEEDDMAVYGVQGRRPTMEDRYQYRKSDSGDIHLYGIFDGHGGSGASEYTRIHLLDAILDRLHKEDDLSATDIPSLLKGQIAAHDRQYLIQATKDNDISGSTCVVALRHKTMLYLANVGDSRAVMLEKSGETVPLSFDHKPDHPEEKRRIERAGGFIAFFGVWRVAGILATSRAIGDLPLKERNFLTAEADIVAVDLSQQGVEFMVLATDGLWDVFSNEEATDLIRHSIGESYRGCKKAVIQALMRGSMDNVTVMVVNLGNNTTVST